MVPRRRRTLGSRKERLQAAWLVPIFLGVSISGCLGAETSPDPSSGREPFVPKASDAFVWRRGTQVLNVTEFPAETPNVTFLPRLEEVLHAPPGMFVVGPNGDAFYLQRPTGDPTAVQSVTLWRLPPGAKEWTAMELPPYLGMDRPTVSYWTFHIDHATGRYTLSGHDWAGHDLCGSFSWSDDGETWPMNPLVCNPPLGTAHVTLSGVPRGIPSPVYPSVFYVCAAPSGAMCAHSFDGGATWSAGVPVGGPCTIVPKHVAADGRLYGVGECDRGLVVVASDDNAMTWRSGTVGPPIGEDEATDAALTTDDAGNVYVARRNRTANLELYVSRDAGATWGAAKPILPHEPRPVMGVSIVAGAAGRAAVAFWAANSSAGDWRLNLAWIADALEPESLVGTLRVSNGVGPGRVDECRGRCHTKMALDPTTDHVLLYYPDQCDRSCPKPSPFPRFDLPAWSGFVRESGGSFLRPRP